MAYYSKPHEVREDGSFACSALSCKLVRVKTTLRGYAACGHCLAYLTDKEGTKLAYTLRDLVTDNLKERETKT